MTNLHKLTSLDLQPFYRNTLGIDRLFESMLNRVDTPANNGYPPCNVIRTDEDHYAVELALAGFIESEIDVSIHDGQLVVRAEKAEEETDEVKKEYLHHGIAVRSFVKTFQLADYVEVLGAKFQDGILTVRLERLVPESMKPRKIAIESK